MYGMNMTYFYKINKEISTTILIFQQENNILNILENKKTLKI